MAWRGALDGSTPSWDELVAAVPWLSAIPAALAERLGRSEYVVPAGSVDAQRRHLESVLDAHVMTYRVPCASPSSARSG